MKTKRTFCKLLFTLLLAFSVGSVVVPTSVVYARSASLQATYTVQPGDTLYRIAQRFGTTVDAIRSANGLTSDSIYVGQQLSIPGGQPQPTPVGSSTYTVQPGDTLYRIAQRFGTTVDAIRSANGLTSDSIYVGQRLTIPGGGSLPSPQRIQFAPGATSATVSGRLQNATPANYLLGALAGQTMRIELLSDNGVADFSLRGASGGQLLKPLEARDSIWTGTLPSTQDYVIQIASLANESPTYQLSVEIGSPLPPPLPAPQRIQFIPGASWATVRGATSAAQPARYVLHVLGGQIMSINLNADNGGGYITVLKPNGASMPEAGGELQNWAGTLPVSGDYIIEVFNPRPGSANFNLTVAIQ